jgi:putative transposase
MGDVRSAPSLIEKLPKAARVLGDTAYDSDEFREFLIARGSIPVIKPNPTRKNIPPFDRLSYKDRNVIERAFSHLKDWRRVATRYDKLARNYRATTPRSPSPEPNPVWGRLAQHVAPSAARTATGGVMPGDDFGPRRRAKDAIRYR